MDHRNDTLRFQVSFTEFVRCIRLSIKPRLSDPLFHATFQPTDFTNVGLMKEVFK